MKRYNTTPNRLSYASGKYIPPEKRYTSNYFPVLFIVAIALVIILVVYKSCYNNTIKQHTKIHNDVIIDEHKPENNKNLKKAPHKKTEKSLDMIPRDSLPPETNLKILTDDH